MKKHTEAKSYTVRTIRTRRKSLNNNLHNRFYNCKFGQAVQYTKDEPKPIQELALALARVLGNIGWFDSKEDIEDWIDWEEIDVKDIQTILKHALANIKFDSIIPW